MSGANEYHLEHTCRTSHGDMEIRNLSTGVYLYQYAYYSWGASLCCSWKRGWDVKILRETGLFSCMYEILTSLRAGKILLLQISIWWWKSLSVTISSSRTFALRCCLVKVGGAGLGGRVGGEGGAGVAFTSSSCLAAQWWQKYVSYYVYRQSKVYIIISPILYV